jgi:hypothetical protein
VASTLPLSRRAAINGCIECQRRRKRDAQIRRIDVIAFNHGGVRIPRIETSHRLERERGSNSEPHQGNGAVPDLRSALSIFVKSSNIQNDSFERRHPEIELAKQNEIALKLERQQDARS